MICNTKVLILSTFVVVFSGLIPTISTEAAFDICLAANSLTRFEAENLKLRDNLNENQLCFTKCMAEQVNFIDRHNGNVIVQNFQLIDVATSGDMNPKREKIIRNCLSHIGLVTTCHDMNKGALEREVFTCMGKFNIHFGQILNMQLDSQFGENELCFMECVAKEADFLDEDGNIKLANLKMVPDMFRMTLDPDVEKHIENCLAKIRVVENCGTMNKVKKCFSDVMLPSGRRRIIV